MLFVDEDPTGLRLITKVVREATINLEAFACDHICVGLFFVDDVLDKTKQLFAKIFGQLYLDSICHTVAHIGTTTAAFRGCALTTVVCTTICVLGALRLLRIIRTKFVLFVRCPVGLDLDVSFATERVGLAVAIFECLLFTSDVSVAVELCRFV